MHIHYISEQNNELQSIVEEEYPSIKILLKDIKKNLLSELTLINEQTNMLT